MYNFKVIYYCQRCKREHDRTNESMFYVGVKCDYCSGYIITPNGRTNMRIKRTADVYLILGKTKSAWIAATSKIEATTYFESEIDPISLKASKLTEDKLSQLSFCFDPIGNSNPEEFMWATPREMLMKQEVLPTSLYELDNSLIENISKKLNDTNDGEL